MKSAKLILSLLLCIILCTGCEFTKGKTSDGSQSFTSVLYGWSEEQKETSNEVFERVLPESVETQIVGKHYSNGSQWAIPNIIRNLLGL